VRKLIRLAFCLSCFGPLLAASAPVAHATDILINNGLAPPNPANVIDHSAYQSDRVFVRNVACGELDPWGLCASPGEETSVAIRDGAEAWYLFAHDTSSITMSGGTVTGNLEAHGSSLVTMSGGTVGDLEAHGSSLITMSGGVSLANLEASDSSVITWTGGSVSDDVGTADSSATIVIDGTGFAVGGVPVPYGDLAGLPGILTGTLASGDPINNPIWGSGTITLIPEPSTALLLLTGLFGLAGYRRGRARG